MLLKRLNILRKSTTFGIQWSRQNIVATRWTNIEALQHRNQISLLSDSKLLHQFFIRGISNSQRDSDVKWLYPASPEVELRDAGNRNHTQIYSFMITLNAASPISSDDMVNVLSILYRRTSFLRACLRKRDNQLWVCEMTSPQLDFKVLEGSNWRREAEELHHQGFDSHNGPLWRSAFIPDAGIWSPVNEVLEASYPYQHKLLFHVHSGLWRGVMFVKVVKLIIDLLNCRISLEDETDIARNMSEEEILEFDEIFNSCRETYPPHLRAEINERLALNHRPLLVEAFEVPKDAPDVTHFKSCEFSLESSRKIFSQCRSKGLTVNNFLISVINAAIVQMMKDAGIHQESFNIVSCLAVDPRRYMKGDDVSMVQNAPGLLLSHLKATPNNVLSVFWEYAFKLHTEIQSRLAQKSPIYEVILTKERTPSNLTYDDHYTGDNLVNYDYGISNFGMLMTLPGEEEQTLVKLTYVELYETIQKRGIPHLFMVYTLKGQLIFTNSYSTKYMTEATINNLHDNISKIISAVIE